MNIIFFETSPDEQEFFTNALPTHTLSFHNEPITQENVLLAKDADIISIFVYSHITSQMLELLKIKAIVTRSTGFDHIDVKTCVQKNIIVCNVPFYGENTVAEHTFALILALSRNVHKSYVRALQGNYSLDGLEGFDLKGKTLGVIGAGHIGLHVIRIAKGFGMHVIAYDPFPNTFLAEVMHYTYASMDEVLKKSDIVSLHVPFRSELLHLMNKEKFAMMKKGSIFINTARGSLVDTDALINALQNEHLAGAGLDVLEGEELIKEEHQLLHTNQPIEKLKLLMENHILLKMDTIVFTPHNAFNSKEAIQRIMQTTYENILGVLAVKPVNRVN